MRHALVRAVYVRTGGHHGVLLNLSKLARYAQRRSSDDVGGLLPSKVCSVLTSFARVRVPRDGVEISARGVRARYCSKS